MTTAETLKADEGWDPYVYQDNRPEKYWTIGFGFLVDRRRGGGMPKEVGEFWLALELRKITEALTERWPPFSAQPMDVQEALKEAAYQLGVDGLLGFRLALVALERGDRETAASEFENSGWHEQTKARCERVAGRIRGHA